MAQIAEIIATIPPIAVNSGDHFIDTNNALAWRLNRCDEFENHNYGYTSLRLNGRRWR